MPRKKEAEVESLVALYERMTEVDGWLVLGETEEEVEG